jgi:hypothetical protein
VTKRRFFIFAIGLIVFLAGAVVLAIQLQDVQSEGGPEKQRALSYQPRDPEMDSSGFGMIAGSIPAWETKASLQKIADLWRRPGFRYVERLDRDAATNHSSTHQRIQSLFKKVLALNFEGEARQAYQVLEEARPSVEKDERLEREYLFTIIYLQGVVALRIGENENCILCRGESSCIIPIAPAAVHRNPEGSRLAIQHFHEYLRQFPDDLEIRWLLNLAHMTLGEYPDKVDPQFLVKLDRFLHDEFNIGKFRDVGHLVGVNRLNLSGGAIMDDFDNDGLLDLVISCFDPTEPMAFYRNKGDGTFEECAAKVGLSTQMGGGLQCVQCDYNNDGWLDIFVCRGAWLTQPVRPSLLRNNGDGTFTDVTEQAGLSEPLNSSSAAWADYDNDGFLDLFVTCERQPNRLYRNKGDGTFEEVAERAGLTSDIRFCKGAAWIDYDNDDYPDLFLNNLQGEAQLFHNNRDGTFRDVTWSMGIQGPAEGFSCWAWDFDNDGWLDIFALSFDIKLVLPNAVKGLQGQPQSRRDRNKLYRNQKGKKFQEMAGEAGVDHAFFPMGSNFGDFDNDGYLDFYLGTGGTNLATLVPNRMFKNVSGKRFAEITTSSGTGHLQKGHGVACGDWDRDGDVDIFIEMGGAINGDKYHNILFQNPGQGNHWLTVKLVGRKTNRAAFGARIKAVTAGDKPLTVYRHVSSGSSFGANSLEQTLGLAQAKRVAELEIHWPTSGTTQIFRDIAVDQAIEVTEFAKEYRRLNWTPIPLPAPKE